MLWGEPWNLDLPFHRYQPKASNGVLDLRKYDFQAGGILKLNGDWEFYWSALLSPSDLESGLGTMSGYISPRFWNGYPVDGRPLSGSGYATYVLRILMDPDGNRLSLRIPAQSTSFRLWVNGREVAVNGVVGISAADSVPQYMPLTVGITNDNPELIVVMQVSNYMHRRGGMWDPLEIADEYRMLVKNNRLVLMDMFSIGSMFTMALYHIVLYAERKKYKSALYFAGICLCFGLRAMIVGEIAVTKMWPAFSWPALLRLEYFTSGGILPFALLFLWELYPTEISWSAVRTGIALFAVFFVVVAVTPTVIGSLAMVYYQVGSVTLSGYIIYVLVSAALRRREGAIWLALSTLVFVATLVNDMLYFNGIVQTMTMSSLGLTVVCFAQSYVLSARFSSAMTSVETLRDQLTMMNQQLSELNQRLEQRVSERTAELLESNKRLEQNHAEIERMEQSRKHLLANIAHDLRTPITLIRGYVEAMLDGVIEDPQQRTKHLKLIATKVAGLSSLIADLFELTQLESRRVTFNRRPMLVTDLVDGLYMKYEGDMSHAGISPVLERPQWAERTEGSGPMVVVDSERIDRVISNLIYNALKFTPRGGTVTVSYGLAETGAPTKPPTLVVCVRDTGSGISAEDLPYVFDRFYKAPRARSNAPGSGLGLSIAREIVELHGGQIWAESTPGEGASFCFTLPLQSVPPTP